MDSILTAKKRKKQHGYVTTTAIVSRLSMSQIDKIKAEFGVSGSDIFEAALSDFFDKLECCAYTSQEDEEPPI